MPNAIAPPRQEFERRFLVVVSELPAVMPIKRTYRQGYLGIDPLQMRIRVIDGAEAQFQIKGKGKFESSPMPLPVAEATYLLDQYRVAGSTDILKDWHAFPPRPDSLFWEVHLFLAENVGLVIAEIEMPNMDHALGDLPAFIRPENEITSDSRFKNKNLTMRPFLSWPEEERLETLRRMGHELP